MGKKVLVTRPKEQARAFADDIRELGVDPVIFPVLDIQPVSFALPSEIPDALIITSAQVFSVLETRKQDVTPFLPCPVYCVGDVSAQKARSYGFSDVRTNGNGGVDELMALVVSEIPAGTLHYWRGEDVTRDLVGTYPAYQWTEIVMYRADAVRVLPNDLRADFPNLFCITLFSKRSGEILADLIKEYGLEMYVSDINLLCLSSQVLDSVSHFRWKAVYVARTADQSSLYHELETILREKV